MFQAITTKWLAPTNTKGSRIKATTGSGISKVYPWDHGLSVEGNHTQAALALAEHLCWAGTWIGGGLNDSGYCYVTLGTDQSMRLQLALAQDLRVGIDWFYASGKE